VPPRTGAARAGEAQRRHLEHGGFTRWDAWDQVEQAPAAVSHDLDAQTSLIDHLKKLQGIAIFAEGVSAAQR
jgi:hypothetical protein